MPKGISKQKQLHGKQSKSDIKKDWDRQVEESKASGPPRFMLNVYDGPKHMAKKDLYTISNNCRKIETSKSENRGFFTNSFDVVNPDHAFFENMKPCQKD